MNGTFGLTHRDMDSTAHWVNYKARCVDFIDMEEKRKDPGFDFTAYLPQDDRYQDLFWFFHDIMNPWESFLSTLAMTTELSIELERQWKEDFQDEKNKFADQ